MIRHIVLLPFKDELNDNECLELLKGLGALIEIIPEIQSFSCGKNNSPENLDRGYLFGFVMEFLTAEDREIYLNHPAHINYATNKILPNLVNGINSPIVFDYEL
ncbi:Dabb family protein [Legionella cincinnatiensis]|uniref:Stress responsive A/B barrel domain protein n=1 Tax=Legionella cincinnatiensis TaxID=28085 RepID=A0A378IIW1_9GAMM|nr:Dabb family protein [Legionella cincinnatiensis]KTC93190.1 Stress responsive A/B barrel domain protein [Legionella cincinnatiensis]STX35109.1 Stress responsive A/B barrel domain protein [Legionella cincinnatiensis]